MARNENQHSKNFEDFYRGIRGSLYTFSKHLGFVPTFQQKQLFDAVEDAMLRGGKRRIAVASGQGPGKTASTAVVGLWLVMRHRNAKLIITAPSMAQCQDVWLAQAKKHIDSNKAHPYLKLMYQFQGKGFGCFGQKPNTWGCMCKTAVADENARGQHEDHMYVLVDEASGVDRSIITQYKGTLRNKDNLLIQISNPTKRDSDFFDCSHKNCSQWLNIHWNGEETPDSDWFSQAQNREIAREFGKKSNVYRVNVLGMFPDVDAECLFSEEILGEHHELSHRHLAMSMPAKNGGPPERAIGIDYSNRGGDESVIVRRQGNAVLEISAQHGLNPNEITNVAFMMQERAGWTDEETLYIPDAVGMGQGILHRFEQCGKRVFPYMSNKTPKNNRKYKNMATEAWFDIHRKMTVEKQPFYIPRDNLLLSQLTGRQYGFDENSNLLLIEPKKIYRARTKRESPDRADAFVQAFYSPVRELKIAS